MSLPGSGRVCPQLYVVLAFEYFSFFFLTSAVKVWRLQPSGHKSIRGWGRECSTNHFISFIFENAPYKNPFPNRLAYLLAGLPHLAVPGIEFANKNAHLSLKVKAEKKRVFWFLADLKPFFLKTIRTFGRKTGKPWKHWPQQKNCCRTERPRRPRL